MDRPHIGLLQLFGKPLRLTAIEGFAEGPTLSPDERLLYYHKKEGHRFVIYRVNKAKP